MCWAPRHPAGHRDSDPQRGGPRPLYPPAPSRQIQLDQQIKQDKCLKTNTHVFLELREGFANAILQEDHSLPVGPPLGRGVQALADCVVEEGGRGGAVDVAAGQSGDGGRSVYVE